MFDYDEMFDYDDYYSDYYFNQRYEAMAYRLNEFYQEETEALEDYRRTGLLMTSRQWDQWEDQLIIMMSNEAIKAEGVISSYNEDRLPCFKRSRRRYLNRRKRPHVQKFQIQRWRKASKKSDPAIPMNSPFLDIPPQSIKMQPYLRANLRAKMKQDIKRLFENIALPEEQFSFSDKDELHNHCEMNWQDVKHNPNDCLRDIEERQKEADLYGCRYREWYYDSFDFISCFDFMSDLISDDFSEIELELTEEERYEQEYLDWSEQHTQRDVQSFWW